MQRTMQLNKSSFAEAKTKLAHNEQLFSYLLTFNDSGHGLMKLSLGRGSVHRKREASEMFNSLVSCVTDWKCREEAQTYSQLSHRTFAEFWGRAGGRKTEG